MRKIFTFTPDEGSLLKEYEDKIKYINGYDINNRSTTTDFVAIDSNVGKTVPVIKYRIFDGCDDIVHGFSTRLGGVSRDCLSTMNLSFSRGDSRENVIENHIRFARAVGYDYKSLVFSDQVHKDKIYMVTKKDMGKGIVRESDIKGIDGLVTNVPEIPLMTFYADCVPLYFFDPVKRVVGMAHSGWRGTVEKIGAKMIDFMKKNYDSDPKDVLCAIGPSICKDCYEVGSDVAEEFERAFSANEYNSIIYKKDNGKYRLDLQKACVYNLINSGIQESNIGLPDMCTCCNSNVLFSHRATRGRRGNLAGVIMLKKA